MKLALAIFFIVFLEIQRNHYSLGVSDLFKCYYRIFFVLNTYLFSVLSSVSHIPILFTMSTALCTISISTRSLSTTSMLSRSLSTPIMRLPTPLILLPAFTLSTSAVSTREVPFHYHQGTSTRSMSSARHW